MLCIYTTLNIFVDIAIQFLDIRGVKYFGRYFMSFTYFSVVLTDRSFVISGHISSGMNNDNPLYRFVISY